MDQRLLTFSSALKCLPWEKIATPVGVIEKDSREREQKRIKNYSSNFDARVCTSQCWMAPFNYYISGHGSEGSKPIKFRGFSCF
jgi:hypothetical protein